MWKSGAFRRTTDGVGQIREDQVQLAMIVVGFLLSAAPAKAAETYKPCAEDPGRLKARATELQTLEQADQADRPGNVLKPGAQSRDAVRRARVGAILGEGCLRTKADYLAAALIYQHGGDATYDPKLGAATALAPEQNFLAFYFASRAHELGASGAAWLVAAAADRYLVGTGKKQLFGTQFFKFGTAKCFCLMPVEASFPDARRTAFTGKTLDQALAAMKDLPGVDPSCKPAYCDARLAPAPAGSVPGFW